MRLFLISLLLAFSLTAAYTQNTPKSFTVKFIEQPITLDAVLEEESWLIAESANNFIQYFPTDTLAAIQQTEIKMLYDATTLYLGIRQNLSGKDFVVPSLRRDYRAGGNDNISLLFDTFNDGTTAFLFGINPFGVQREALISAGGTDLRGFNTTWDVKWKAETKIYKDHYIAEIAIPLTSFKFKEGETQWRFNSYRFDMMANEQTVWQRIPQNQLIFNLAFMGNMVFEKPLGRSRTPMALIPYINASAQKDYEANVSESNIAVGGDAKISVSNGLNLDVTLIPDFSNVEVDDIFTNLTRFEVGLPERRQFFIDNGDLFADFGNPEEANPFFSRRIGIARDVNDNSIQNDIIGGVRLSGKINNNWRLGFLNMQTEEDASNEIASNNNTVLALQKKVFSRSNIGFIFVNRETFGNKGFTLPEDRYNRVAGLDYNLASADNSWVGKAYFHKSFAHNTGNKDISTGIDINYNSRNWGYGVESRYIGEDFRSDLGFILRKDIFLANPYVLRNIWPQKGAFNLHTVGLSTTVLWRPGLDFQNTDYSYSMFYESRFNNNAEMNAELRNDYIFLTEDFEPTGKENALALPAGTDYHFASFEAEYTSDPRKIFSWSVNPSVGEFFNGNIYSFSGGANVRVQPKFLASVFFNFDRLELPQPYSSASLLIVQPRFEVTFNKSLFWSTTFQYSKQQDNLGINSRLQWRFAQLSDLFIVYNDNYFVNAFMPRNRSINLKLTYWLNI